MRNLQLSHNNSRMLSLPSQADTAHHWLPSPVFDKECAMDRTLKPQPASSTPLECPLYLRAYATLCNWRRNWHTRQQLARLDSRQLADAGISEAQRQAELEKPFWR